MKKTLSILLSVFIFIVALAMMPVTDDNPLRHYSADELKELHENLAMPPLDSADYFLKPSNCRGCHGFDTLALANIDDNGMDVNLYDDWETSMMGLSGVDPLWKAKVSHEILVNPGHSDELQNFCTSCHAPAGHYTAFFKGYPTHYTLAHLDTDSLGRSGVSCMGCHTIGSNGLGQTFSGNITYDTSRLIFGPFVNPVQGPMQLYEGLTPVFANHMSESRVCSSCHTLISNTVDLNGNPTGGTFTEQATYHEWQNSDYPSLNTTCQSCHMPQIEDPIIIANGSTGLSGRSPFNLHSFAGANSFMVNLIKNNKASLGVTASDANFDSTLAAINKQLTLNTLNVEVNNDAIANDSAFFSVTITNKAGHKFPSGYPSRRAVLQFVVTKANGDTLFASGLFDPTQEIININPVFETHYDIINDPSQVQVYEMVMADVNGDKTTVLERSASALKDNRIPPLGFTTTHSTYDTCLIVGAALTDADFNKNGGVEGSGKDIVHYQVNINGYQGMINVSASVYYQSVPPGWLSEMFAFNSPEIDTFRNMYNIADTSPLLIAKDTLQNINISVGLQNTLAASSTLVYPTISKNGIITITGIVGECEVKLYNERGQLLKTSVERIGNKLQFKLPETVGVYFIHVSTTQFNVAKKVFRL